MDTHTQKRYSVENVCSHYGVQSPKKQLFEFSVSVSFITFIFIFKAPKQKTTFTTFLLFRLPLLLFLLFLLLPLLFVLLCRVKKALRQIFYVVFFFIFTKQIASQYHKNTCIDNTNKLACHFYCNFCGSSSTLILQFCIVETHFQQKPANCMREIKITTIYKSQA